MDFYIANQTLVFLYACAMGACLSVIYDIFRLVRITFTIGKIAVIIEDILFFLIVSACTFIFIICFTEGMIRFYVVAGELLGFILCHLTLGALIVTLLGGLIRLVKRALRKICVPVKALFLKLFRAVRAKMLKISVKHKKNNKNIKKSLQNNQHIGYNHFIPKVKRRRRCKNGGKTKKTEKI